jgi:transposase InsO family protein
MGADGTPNILAQSFGACRSQPLRFIVCCTECLDKRHNRTRPCTPRTNGKAQRFIQTLCREWAYAMAFQNSEERNRWLPRYLAIYNRLRKHSALGWRSPQRIQHTT